MLILASKGLMVVDEMRRCIEGLEEATYRSAPYYEKWAVGIATTMLERGHVSHADLEAALGPAEAAPAEPFAPGAVVRVRRSSHATRWRRPHLRTPGFIHGVCGVVERRLGDFANPEKLAFGGLRSGSKLPLYCVRFDWHSVCDFGAGVEAADADAVTVDVYHSWLEPAGAEELERQRRKRKAQTAALDDGRGCQPDCQAHGGQDSGHSHGHGQEADTGRGQEADTGHGHGHGHGHSRGHGHGHGQADHGSGHGHVHEERAADEQRAVDSAAPCPAIARALVSVLESKGLVTAEELRAQPNRTQIPHKRRLNSK